MILLISDLHLQEERPDITRAFFRFLRQRAAHAEALYILGDFFEAWIGDDGMTPFQANVADALREVSDGGTDIYLMHGNRDFLIGEAFCRRAGCRLLPDPSVVELGGERVLLTHGDALCTEDVGYMRLRRVLRNPLVLGILTRLPLSTRRRLAKRLRNESRTQTRMKASHIVDVTAAAVPPLLERFGVRTLIHGHTHRPATHELEHPAGGKRIVLGDWDSQGWALQADASGLHQAAFELTAS